MKSLLSAVIVYGVVALNLAACNSGKEQAAAEEARREADGKVAEAEREANEKKRAAEKEAADARAEADAARVEARAAIQKDIAAADRKAADLKERAAKAKGKAKLNAEAAATEFDRRRAVVEQDLQTLTAATGEQWDKLKVQTERNVDAVEEAVASLDRTVSP
jgi:hypothetical protein